jgi:UDP-glucose 4-epimerase
MTLNRWRDARVLVTGARGFIGTRLCSRLLDAGAVVHGISRVVAPEGAAGVQWSTADLTNADAVRGLIERVAPDAVFHLAGHVTGSQDIANVEPTFYTNRTSTVHLLTVAAEKRLQARLVLVGSMQEPDPDHPAPTPCSPYAASKWACSAYARMFHALYQLPVAIARPMMVYGPGQWDLVKVLPYVMVSLLGGTSPALGSGGRELDWVFVDDVVDGMLAVAAAEIDGQTVDLGSGTLTSVRSVVEQAAALIGSEAQVRFGAIPDRPLERPCAARAEETRRLIGWSARTPLADGLKQTVAWYRETWSSLRPV